MISKLKLNVILTAVCLSAAACTAETSHTTSGEMLQTEEVTVNTEPFESSEVAIAETTTTDAAIKEAIIFEDKLYTFSEISEELEKQGIQWEAYYNGSGERIDMYCKDGSELLFLKSGGDSKKVGSDGMILVMQNDQFFKLGFQTGYQIDLGQTADFEYYPQTAKYYLSETELMGMNQTDLKIALHEIYARHGKQMAEPFLQALFSLKTWYEPKYGDDNFVRIQDTLLNEFEKENVRAILANQKKRGFVDDKAVDNETVEYKVPRSIVEGSYIDLDLDGLGERVVFDFMYAGPYQVAREYMVMINPKVPGDFKLSGVIDSMPVAIYAASLDGKTTQLIMSGNMNDGKPRTDIYSYQNGEAKLAGRIDANNLEIMEDCFWAYQYDGKQTMPERAKFKYEDGMVIETGITEHVRDDTAGGDTANDDNRMRTLIKNFDFERSRIAYSEVAAALEGIGIGWESRLNLSGERLDLICDDGTGLILMETGLSEKELIMAGERLSEQGFKRVLIQEQVAGKGDFYYPETSERPLTGEELSLMNLTELSIARNEIYARHGRHFADPFLHAVFSRKSWYKPKYDGTEFSGKADQLFNTYEKENVMLLVEAEKRWND